MLVTDNLRDYSTQTMLRDGTLVCLRAIGPDDKERLAAHFEQLSAQSRYSRFLGFRTAFTPRELSSLTELDFVRHVGLVATLGEGAGVESVVGDGRYAAVSERRSAAELALSVVDAYQRRGLGTLLLEDLIRLARHAGVRRLEADVLGSNWRALRFFRRRGFKPLGISSGVCRMALSLQDHTGFQEKGSGLSRLNLVPQMTNLPPCSGMTRTTGAFAKSTS
jgi:ribosomal protein S18 acetylase RimI-like enzyme